MPTSVEVDIDMESRSVSRCVAIAAHGKRCQQSPFRGSPYCWHHTQSRKIWAPSRPMSTTSAGGRTVTPSADESAADRASAPLGERAALDLAARRLAELLGPRGTEDLLSFLEGGADGTYVIMRTSENGLIGERSIGEPPARRRTA
jgi:hypothetical protein